MRQRTDQKGRTQMMSVANDFEPAEVFSLAEYLSDELIARGWKTEDAAVRMRTKHGAAHDLFFLDIVICVPDEKLMIDDDGFAGLARAFGVNAQFLKNLHDLWMRYPDRRSPFEVPDSLFGPVSRRSIIHPVRG